MNLEDERAEKALNFLAQTDADAGRLKGRVESLKRLLKRVEASKAVEYSGTETISKANQMAKASEDYKRVCDELEETETKYFKLMNHRDTAHVVIEAWRTVSASRRRA